MCVCRYLVIVSNLGFCVSVFDFVAVDFRCPYTSARDSLEDRHLGFRKSLESR